VSLKKPDLLLVVTLPLEGPEAWSSLLDLAMSRPVSLAIDD
jgi:hypothetical protein